MQTYTQTQVHTSDVNFGKFYRKEQGISNNLEDIVSIRSELLKLDEAELFEAQTKFNAPSASVIDIAIARWYATGK